MKALRAAHCSDLQLVVPADGYRATQHGHPASMPGFQPLCYSAVTFRYSRHNLRACLQLVLST